MTWWMWLLVAGVGALSGAFVGLVIALGRESTERRRGGMLDLVGATPRDPDDWFAPIIEKRGGYQPRASGPPPTVPPPKP